MRNMDREVFLTRMALWLIIVSYTAYFSFLTLERWNLMLCGGDYGIIDSSTHSTAHGNFMWSPALNYNFWIQHISPILLFLSAFYLFSDAYWFSFVYETVTIGLAGVPLFYIALRLLKNARLALLVVVAFFATGCLQYANLFEYHMEGHEPLFIFLAFYGILEKKWKTYATGIVLLTFCKEDAFIMASALAFYAFAVEKERKVAVLTWVYCAVYALVLFKVGYPYFRGNESYQYVESYYSWLGNTPVKIVINLLTNPLEILQQRLANGYIAERWWSYVFENGVILPLLSPVGAIMALPVTMELFLSVSANASGLTHHYPFHIIPAWAIATTLALANIKSGVEFISERSSRFAWAELVRKSAIGVFAAVAALYSLALLYFAFYGPFDFKLLSARVNMGDPVKPIGVLAVVTAGLLIIGNAKWVKAAIGKEASTRVLSLILLFMIGAKLYNGIEYGALPFYSSWSKYVGAIDKEHAEKVKELIKQVPHGAKVVTNQGIFAHLHHHTEAYYSSPASYFPPLREKKIDFLLLDSKDPLAAFRNSCVSSIEGLLVSKEYGLVTWVDGAALFGKGVNNNHRPFVEYYTTSTVRSTLKRLATQIGEEVDDKTSPYGASITLRPGMRSGGGFLVYGPYLRLLKGEYEAQFRMKVDKLVEGTVAEIDVTAGEAAVKLAGKEINGRDFGSAGAWVVFKAPFRVDAESLDKVELRVRYLGGPVLSVDMTRVEMSLAVFQNYLTDKLPEGEEPERWTPTFGRGEGAS
ncbi:MAG: DUF2079 domain-containing protein [Nitrospinae bacterium]|nr:DUF2079 domain-containing protein [Nitrospinota bacterium]